MAKRKHAAALFEVFHDNKSTPARANRAPGWWFKGRETSSSDEPTTVVDENDPTTMPIRSPLIAPRIAAVEAMDPPVAKAAPVVRMEARQHSAPAEPSAPPRERQTRSLAASWASRCNLDPDSREVTMRLPFTTAIIAASGILLCIALAYVLGRRSAESQVTQLTSQLAGARSASSELRPSALDVPRHAARLGAVGAPSKPSPRPAADDNRYRDRESTPVANSVHDIDPVAPPDVAPVDGPRIIGLNYLLVQSYPNDAAASEARDFLISNGVSCTVEKVPKIFLCPDPNWRSVITTRGFDREHYRSAEYENFKHQLEKLGDKFAGNGKFKRFALLPYVLKSE